VQLNLRHSLCFQQVTQHISIRCRLNRVVLILISRRQVT
jgi:hypothetical protein